MASRLALCAAVATTVFCITGDASAQTFEVTPLVPGSAFHGVHGLGIDKQGRLFAGSVAGAALYEVDRDKGTAKIAIPSPEGMADDIAFAPDGTMAWTGFLTGDLYARKGDGPIKKLASMRNRQDAILFIGRCGSDPIAMEAPMTRVTRDDVINAVGIVDDVTIAQLIGTGATREELAEAKAWLSNDEPLMNAGKPLAKGRVGELVDILTELEDSEEDEAGPPPVTPG